LNSRHCRNCVHYAELWDVIQLFGGDFGPDAGDMVGRGVCLEGGLTEVGDPYAPKTGEDCNAFEERVKVQTPGRPFARLWKTKGAREDGERV
jgi:hypothetical protein